MVSSPFDAALPQFAAVAANLSVLSSGSRPPQRTPSAGSPPQSPESSPSKPLDSPSKPFQRLGLEPEEVGAEGQAERAQALAQDAVAAERLHLAMQAAEADASSAGARARAKFASVAERMHIAATTGFGSWAAPGLLDSKDMSEDKLSTSRPSPFGGGGSVGGVANPVQSATLTIVRGGGAGGSGGPQHVVWGPNNAALTPQNTGPTATPTPTPDTPWWVSQSGR
ncbi:hypothetical protein WJX81_002177 [Elliptochloris bilobata]|uniref:Uncharacterized protein n=1 Tax=Elliptochloris bilobata TaxID=381761 RepID=A0AAW1QYG0_9CHLO